MTPALHSIDAAGVFVPWSCPEWDKRRILAENLERSRSVAARLQEVDAEVAALNEGASARVRESNEAAADKRRAQLRELADPMSHVVLRYLRGVGRFDLDAPAEPEGPAPRDYLTGPPSVEIHLRRISQARWAEIHRLAEPTLERAAKVRRLSVEEIGEIELRDRVMRGLAVRAALAAGVSKIVDRRGGVERTLLDDRPESPEARERWGDAVLERLHEIDADLPVNTFAPVLAFSRSLSLVESFPSA